MAEFMTGLKRTHYCGDLRISDVGSEVTVCGWVQRVRDLGQLIFIDLRDRTGIVQLAFNDETDREIFNKAFSCRSEFVLAAKGVVCERSAKNPDIPTGDIEITVTDLRVLSKAQTPPFEIVDDSKTGEDVSWTIPKQARTSVSNTVISTCAAVPCSITSCCAARYPRLRATTLPRTALSRSRPR